MSEEPEVIQPDSLLPFGSLALEHVTKIFHYFDSLTPITIRILNQDLNELMKLKSDVIKIDQQIIHVWSLTSYQETSYQKFKIADESSIYEVNLINLEPLYITNEPNFDPKKAEIKKFLKKISKKAFFYEFPCGYFFESKSSNSFILDSKISNPISLEIEKNIKMSSYSEYRSQFKDVEKLFKESNFAIPDFLPEFPQIVKIIMKIIMILLKKLMMQNLH